MEAVYVAPYAIPELGVDEGDVITVRISHPVNPLLVTKRHAHHRLPLLLPHIGQLTRIDADAEALQEAPRRRAPSTSGRPRDRQHLRAI